jgi:hypothetical protein
MSEIRLRPSKGSRWEGRELNFKDNNIIKVRSVDLFWEGNGKQSCTSQQNHRKQIQSR